MSTPPPDSLTRLFERDPDLAVALPPLRGGAVRSLLAPVRVLATVVLTPVLWSVYRGSIDGPVSGPAWLLLLTAISVTGALVISTYLPSGRGRAQLGTPCAALGGVYVLFAAMALDAPASLANGVFALAAVGFGLWQRLRQGGCGS